MKNLSAFFGISKRYLFHNLKFSNSFVATHKKLQKLLRNIGILYHKFSINFEYFATSPGYHQMLTRKCPGKYTEPFYRSNISRIDIFLCPTVGHWSIRISSVWSLLASKVSQNQQYASNTCFNPSVISCKVHIFNYIGTSNRTSKKLLSQWKRTFSPASMFCRLFSSQVKFTTSQRPRIFPEINLFLFSAESSSFFSRNISFLWIIGLVKVA